MVIVLHALGRYRVLQVDWNNLDRWLEVTDPADALMAALRLLGLAVAWWLLATTLLDILSHLPQAPAALRRVRWATLPGIRRIIDGALALSIAGHLAPDITAAAAHQPATVEIEPGPVANQQPVEAPHPVRFRLAIFAATEDLPEPVGDAPLHVVDGGDTFWSIAENRLRDPQRWREIWDLNQERLSTVGVTDPATLHIGWVLQLPPDTPTTQEEPTGGEEAGSREVQAGENLWDIAASELDTQWGRTPTTAEVNPYWQSVIDTNRAALRDPDLIYPGQHLTIPAVPTAPGAGLAEPNHSGPHEGNAEEDSAPEPEPDASPPTSSTDNSADEDGQARSDPSSAPENTTSPTPGTPSGPDEHEPGRAEDGSTIGDSPAPSTTSAPATHTQDEAADVRADANDAGDHDVPQTGNPDDAADESDLSEDEDDSPDSQVVPRVAVPALLAALVLSVVRYRRRVRRRTSAPGRSGVSEPPAEAVEVERGLSAAQAEVDLADRVSTATKALGAAFRGIDGEPPCVQALVVSPDGEVTIHVDPVIPPPDPFVRTQVGTGWLLDGSATSTGADAEPVLNSIVTVGTTEDGSWVLLDLESLGALEVNGPPEAAAAMLRSFAAELALQPADHLVELITSGTAVPAAETQWVSEVAGIDEATVQNIEAGTARVSAHLTEAGAETTWEARAGGAAGDTLIPTILVGAGGDPVLMSRLAEAAYAKRGFGLATNNPLDPEAAVIDINDRGEVHIPHLQLTAQAAAVEQDALDQVNGLIHDAFAPKAAAPERAAPEDNGDADPEPIRQEPGTEYTPPPWSLCVRIFRHHTVQTHDGQELSFREDTNKDVQSRNTRRGPELLTYLALTRNRSATLTEISQDLWWGKQIAKSSVYKLIHGTRRVLGGAEWLQYPQSDPQNRYHLSYDVLTDLELLEHALDYCQSTDDGERIAEVLMPFLGSIEGPPFQTGRLGQGLADWASANRVIDRAEQAVVEAALLIASTSESEASLARANQAIEHALRACPNHEPLVRAAMQVDYKRGDRDQALRRYKALITSLEVDSLDPEQETARLFDELGGARTFS